MMSRVGRMSVVIAVAVFASSCSYVTMQKPDKLKPDMPVCVSNKLAPTIDSVQAAGSGLSFIGATGAAISGGTQEFSLSAAVVSAVGSAIGAAIWTASAVSGFKRAEACKEVKVHYFSERRTPEPTAQREASATRNDDRNRVEEPEVPMDE